MNNFELFCLIFLALDAQWEDKQNEVLGDYLSGANPFLFTDICSADPEYYENFLTIIKDDNVEISNSYQLAKKYIENINILDVTDAFSKIDESKWLLAAEKYLASSHKGENL